MALSNDTATKNEVSYKFEGLAHSAQSVGHQQVITDAIDVALDTLSQAGQAFDVDGGLTAPDQWRPWLIAEATLAVALALVPSSADQYRRQRDEARELSLRSFANFVSSTTPTSVANPTLQQVRQRIMVRFAGSGVLVDPMLVDEAVNWVINDVWHQKDWGYRREIANFTINADGTVTAVSDFDAILTKRLQYTDDESQYIEFVLADDWLKVKQYYAAATGRPIAARVNEGTGSLVWHLLPAPDKEYAVRGEIQTSSPVYPTAITDTVFSVFPSEVRPLLLERVAAKVATYKSLPNAADMMSVSDRQVDQAMNRLADRHLGDTEGGFYDVYGDAGCIISSDSGFGGWYQ